MISLLRMFGPRPARAIRSTSPRAAVTVVTAVALAASSAAIWSVATASAATPETIWGSATPAPAAVDSDTGAVELGTRFTAVANGQATGIRFYKTAENKGTHTGSLWSSTGDLLARATFSGESSSGWQTASLSAPVKLSAGATYVVSYHSPYGRYTATEWFSRASASPNLSVPSSNIGVYAYGSSSAFPTLSWHASQYWVDLTFSAGSSATTSATPVASTSTAKATPATSTSAASSTSSRSTSTTTSAPPTSVTAAGRTTSSTTSTAPASVKITAATPKLSTPATTTTPATTAGSGVTNCVSLPSRCGYPDATNTGVPAGTAMLRVPQDVKSGPGWVWDGRGWISTSDNAIVENLIIDGHVEATGKNVTVRNNRILQSGEDWAVALRSTVNVNVTHNTIGVTGAPRLLVGIKDIYGDSTGTTVSYNDISNASTGIQLYAGLVERNYIHDLGMNNGDHINGFTSNLGTDPLTIRNNTILVKFNQTDAISLFQDFGVEGNRVITGNLLAGGGYTIYGGMGSKGQSFNIQITNNRFSNIYYANSGSYGTSAYFDSAGPGNVASGNFWDHSLAPVKI